MSKRMAALLTVLLLTSITIATGASRKNSQTARETAFEERVYEIPPNLRISPINRPLYCSDLACGDDSDNRCTQRGHGDAVDHSFHFSRNGSGDCLITCSDGYLLLIVDDSCGSSPDGDTFRPQWSQRSREFWVAPRGAACVDPHEIGRDTPICETSN